MTVSPTRPFFCIFLYGSWSPAALGNLFLICRPNSGSALLRHHKPCYITLTVTTEIETNSRKQESLLVFDSRHNSPARGFGLSVRVEKSLGHVLGVLDVVRHQSMLFVEGEWAAGVIDIRQAAVVSSGGIGIWQVERDSDGLFFFCIADKHSWWSKACLTTARHGG